MDRTRKPNQPEKKNVPQDPQPKRNQGENDLKAQGKHDAQQKEQQQQQQQQKEQQERK